MLAAAVMVCCIASYKMSGKLGIPALLLFIIVGMLFGSEGIFKIQFEDYEFAEYICKVALLFIMFYGGFGTNWSHAKPVFAKAVTMSTLGVVLTTAAVGLFCHFVLKIGLIESFLLGSVISSTDAASVFSILRSKKLNLKHGLASLLEVESGSNDPFSYMLTMIFLEIMSASGQTEPIWRMVIEEIALGAFGGFLIAFLGRYLLRRLRIKNAGMNMIFMAALAVLSFALPMLVGGNGFLSVYIAGMILGNSKIRYKAELVHFFDGVTCFMQIIVFFLLGLLSVPSNIWSVALPSVLIALFLTFIARPISTLLLMSPFRMPIKQQALVAWSGLRGAASVLFAIIVMVSGVKTQNNFYHIVLLISMLSVMFQGSLLPMVARKLDLVDDDESVMKTFNDYQDEGDVSFVEMKVWNNSAWVGRSLEQIKIPRDRLVVLVKREDENIVPDGSTVIEAGDVLVFACMAYRAEDDVGLTEVEITGGHKWRNKPVCELDLPQGALVVMIKRDTGAVIAGGNTVIKKNDTLVLSMPK